MSLFLYFVLLILLTLFFENGCWKLTAEILERGIKIFYILFYLTFKKCIASGYYNIISLSRHEQVCLNGLRFERYFSHHQCLSQRSPLKHAWNINSLPYLDMLLINMLRLLFFFFLSDRNIQCRFL